MNSLLDTLVFKSGQKKGKEDTVIIPLLEKLNIPHAISIGSAAHNMAEAYEKSVDVLYQREEAFLAKNQLLSLKNAVISGVPQPNQPKITVVTSDDTHQTKSGRKIQTECLFTTSPDVLLIHKPADCPTAIIGATGKNDENILGLVHLGRPQVNEQLVEYALDFLTQTYGSKPTEIFIGISPSIGPNYYWVKQADQNEKSLIDRKYWGIFAGDDEVENENVIRIDVLGKILLTLTQHGIPPENIQAYGHAEAVDTYALANLNPPQTFSHRYATNTNQPHRNGRIMIAAQLSGV
jgi:copper oxidase (laccase) domain-containing protein